MFGNRLGWLIAVGLALLFCVGGWRLNQINGLTPLTLLGASAAVYEPLELPMAPSAIVAMDQSGDAGKLYRAVIDAVQNNTAHYQSFADSGAAKEFDTLPAIQKLIDATQITGGDILLADPAANIGYIAQSDQLKSILLAAHCLSREALLIGNDQPVRANDLYRAEFALGAKLFAERITYFEAFDGLGLMQEAIGGLRISAKANHNAQLIAALSQFNTGINAFVTQTMVPMWKVLGAVDNATIAEHAGDIYAFTGPQMKERLWRIEAILKLGRHKYNVARYADQLIVTQRLADLKATETDPALLTAIKAAQNLTLEQYHMIR